MEPRELMTPQEIHDFGIEIVFGCLKKEGYVIEAVNVDPTKNPQIVAQKDNNLCFIIVRTDCYPNKGKIATEAEFFSILENAQKHNATPYFAPVWICYAEARDEKQAGIPYKAAPFQASYEGLLIMTTSDKIKVLS